MAAKRTINKQQYKIDELVTIAWNAEVTVQDIEKATQELTRQGITEESIARTESFYGQKQEPFASRVQRYALEISRLAALEKLTNANFPGQIGRWDWSSREKVTESLNAYLNRRNSARRSRWGK